MAMETETPVTIKCDQPLCPEVLVSINLDRTGGTFAQIRARARDAAIAYALAAGWQVDPIGAAWCTRHRRGLVIL